MAFSPQTIQLSVSPKVIWGGRSSGSSVTIQNPDTANSIYIGSSSNIAVGSSNTWAIGPGQSLTVDGSESLYGCAPTGTAATQIGAGVSAYFQPTTLSNLGGISVFVQATTPTQPPTIPVNSLWFDTANGSLQTWNGSSWSAQQFNAQQLIQTATILDTQVANGTLTSAQLASAAGILGTQIASATITSGNIAANTIVAGNIAANTITAAQIAANTITASQIAASTITAAQIAANSLTASVMGTLGLCLNDNPFFAGGYLGGHLGAWSAVAGTLGATSSPPSGCPTPWAGSVTTTSATFDGLSGNRFLAIPGNVYVWAGWVYCPVSSVNIGFSWLNSGGSDIGDTTQTFTVTANTWTFLSTVQTAVAGAVYGILDATFTATSAGQVLYGAALQALPQVQGIVDATTIIGATIIADGTSGEFLAYSGTPASGNLVASISATSGTDGFGNAYKAGFVLYDTGGGGNYIQLEMGSPPTTTVGDSVNTWKMDQSFSSANTHTIGNTTSASNLSDVVNIPANHATQGTEYIIEVPVTGVFEGGVMNFGMLVGVTFTNLVPTTASAFTTGHNVAGTVRFHLQVIGVGAGGTANIWIDGTLSDATSARAPGTTMALDGISTGIAFNTTIAQNFALGFKWSTSITGQTITGNNTLVSRRGA